MSKSLVIVDDSGTLELPGELASLFNITQYTATNVDRSVGLSDACIVCHPTTQQCVTTCENIRRLAPRPRCFVIVFHKDATESAPFRLACFNVLANMVTGSLQATETALRRVAAQGSKSTKPLFTCPYDCGVSDLTEDELWWHGPLYHQYWPNPNTRCPVCKFNPARHHTSIPEHFRNTHGPCGRGEIEPEKRTGVFAIIICRRPSDGKFLMVQEFAGSGFWVPGGQLDPGESLIEAVKREAIEEAGVDVKVLGILEVSARKTLDWRRVVFYGEPADPEQLPKTVPDYESSGAVWVHVDELQHIKLRGASEPCTWMPYIAEGREIGPLVFPPEYAEKFRDISL